MGIGAHRWRNWGEWGWLFSGGTDEAGFPAHGDGKDHRQQIVLGARDRRPRCGDAKIGHPDPTLPPTVRIQKLSFDRR